MIWYNYMIGKFWESCSLNNLVSIEQIKFLGLLMRRVCVKTNKNTDFFSNVEMWNIF
jgi:hypothetical protein